ncbi:MAG: ABC transporter permease subunit [Desulfobacteraceae bacterium]|nr:MAG: ABC transporter permease subunit [Desulfobacteraceae bacterium]
MIVKAFKNPITRKRLMRFKEMKRAYFSLWIITILYLVSFSSELICNSVPLYVRFQEKSYFPVLKFYPENEFTGSGKQTRPDYHKINNSPAFRNNPGNYMIFTPIPFGPYESIDPKSIAVSDLITLKITPMPMIGTVNIRKDYSIARSARFGSFIGKKEREVKGLDLTEYFSIPQVFRQAVEIRFANQKAPSFSYKTKRYDGKETIIILSTFSPRKRPPKTVRITLSEAEPEDKAASRQAQEFVFNRQLEIIKENIGHNSNLWNDISDHDRKELLDLVQSRFFGPIDTLRLTIGSRNYTVAFIKEDVRFPFAPVKGHLMGIDSAGRDVLARVLYGLRTSMTFGLMLVAGSMILGIITGSLQGYFGGILDITAQRLIEIWSALPFLYIMILMGSTYGRSFSLLLFCYGLFNWIGISYYIRAEFLRLRKQPFVEAAKCMGISSYKIIFKHILPNGMVPVITFFPFSLVGAIGALAALDYLGFGLPPPTPSWGELLFQAQQYRWAWWLILYPSLALFIVMLLSVFVGEGIRNAYDPKRYTRLE